MKNNKSDIRPFFIRLNTKKIRDSLIERGIEQNAYVCDWDDENKWLMVTPMPTHDCITFLTAKPFIQKINNIIDCGTNEDLFMETLNNTENEMFRERWYQNINNGKVFYFLKSTLFNVKHLPDSGFKDVFEQLNAQMKKLIKYEFSQPHPPKGGCLS